MLLETDSPWCAFLDSFRTGTDAAGPVHVLSERMGCRGVRISLVEDLSREDAGVILEVCHGNGDVRSLYSARDGRSWKFGAQGEPLAFEDTSRYRAKRIRDRLPPELAKEYLAALGLGTTDAFFAPGGRARGLLVHRRGGRPDSFREHPVDWPD